MHRTPPYLALFLGLATVAACSSKTDDKAAGSNNVEDMKDEASVDWARQQLPELDAKLASSDPGAASSTCAVIKPDMPKIRKADAALADVLERKCGRDVAVRSMAVAVERIEKDPKECYSISVYEKSVTKANASGDPEVAKLRERVAAVCPKK